jgi:hypothetical protein
MIANNIIHRDTDREGNPTVNRLSIDLLGKQLLGRGSDDCVPKFTQVNDLGAWNTLADKTLQCKVYNLGSLLVLCADITVYKLERSG